MPRHGGGAFYSFLWRVILLAAVLAVGYFWLLPMLREAPAPVAEEVTVNTAKVEEILAPASKLIALEYVYTDMDSYEKTKQLFGKEVPFATDKVFFTYTGRIGAGIDLSRAQIEVDDVRQRITVTLPAPQILTHELDEESFSFYEAKNSVLTESSLEDYTTLIGGLKKAKEAELLADDEFFDRVSDNTEEVLRGLLSSAAETRGYELRFRTVRSR